MRGLRRFGVGVVVVVGLLVLGACTASSDRPASSPSARPATAAATHDEPFFTWQQERVLEGDEAAIAVATHAWEHARAAASRGSDETQSDVRVRLLAVAVDGDVATSTLCRDPAGDGDVAPAAALRLRRDEASPGGWAVAGPAAAIVAPAACVRALRRGAAVEVQGAPSPADLTSAA